VRRAAALLLAAGLAGNATAAGPAAADPAEVVDAFHEALKDGDRQKALEQLAGDVRIFEQGRLDRSRTEYAREHLAEDIAFASATKRTVAQRTVKVHGEVAWVTSVNRARGRYRDRAVDFTTTETMVLDLTGDRWRIVHIHWSFDDQAAR
jgi:ketosteroid isomerase-like protein